MNMAYQYHLAINDGDIAPYVLLPGDPKRVPIVASYWDEAHKVADNREYVSYTGKYKGVPISCVSTGIGCPSTGIAMEELARCGANTFLRIGSCGTFVEYVKNGDMVIFDSACRYDGASLAYAPLEFPAVASYETVLAAVEAAKALGYAHHVGTTRSADTFYASHARPGSSFNNYWQSDWANRFEDLKRLNVVGAEMEASIIFVLARVWGLRAGGMAVCLDNCCEVSGQSGQFDPQAGLEHGRDNIERLSKLGCEAIYRLWQRDTQ